MSNGHIWRGSINAKLFVNIDVVAELGTFVHWRFHHCMCEVLIVI